MTPFDPIAYINEPRWRHSSLGLERTTLLLEKLGNPQNDFLIVHVAGTNGKGSVCAYLASILRAAGLRTGMFTSPFIEHFEERIQVNGESIALDDLTDITLAVREAAEEVEAELGEHPTEFELMCVVGFMHFARSRCAIAVVECGLGGRLDATNVVTPVLSVITRIGLDHTDILGDTLAEIAAEKAGIIKPGVPVVSAPQDAEAARVIEERCLELGCPLYASDYTQLAIDEFFVTDDAAWSRSDAHHGHSRRHAHMARSSSPRTNSNGNSDRGPRADSAANGNVQWTFPPSEDCPSTVPLSGFPPEWISRLLWLPSARSMQASSVLMRRFMYRGIRYETQLVAAYQPRNAAVAIDGTTVLATWHPELGISEKAIKEGIAQATWPGRFEVISTEPLVIVDGAHNPDGAAALAESVRELLGRGGPKVTLVVGVLADKDWRHVVEPMLPFAHRVIAYGPDNPRALSASELAQGAGGLASRDGFDVEVVESPSAQDAIMLAMQKESPEGIVLAFGTLYAIGAVKQAVRAYSSLGVSRP